ncbi:MAG: bacillithiol biosynthesis cysteine-adding enzyme BshC [Gemmatimonadales bacterium]|nr:MAG: bacillithiol biosynthesis cysteine-adding enzyme BshC [Gemmatimonadales bacterium]
MEILTRPLSGSSIVGGYLAHRPEAGRFFPSGFPGDPEAYRASAQRVEERFTRQDRVRLAHVLRGGGVDRDARLKRFVEEDGFAVTTGQQPGLFGGPLFALYKALTAAALARRLEMLLERPVLPVFWVAAEDHDWEEVRRIHLLDPENELESVEIPIPVGREEAPLHRVGLGPEVTRAREHFLSLLPDSDFAPPLRALLEASYGEGKTLPGAFAHLLEELLGPQGIFILSPEHPSLQAASLPILLAEAERAAEVEAELLRRGEALEAGGFGLQVPLLPGGVNLFFEGPRGRDRLFRDGAGFRLRRSGQSITLAELTARAEAEPALLSPNVLLRPVVESRLIPTLSYVAGPGEMAYFAQTAPVFRAHGMEPPVIHPRLSAVLLEGKVKKVLAKFGLEVEALARPHHELASELVRDEIPPEVRAALGGFRGSVARSAKELGDAVKGVDPTLAGPVDHLRNQSFSLLGDVEKKVMQALKRENEVALAQLEKSRLHLYPTGRPQERVLSPFYYLFRYGPSLLGRLAEAAEAAVRLDPVPDPVGGE